MLLSTSDDQNNWTFVVIWQEIYLLENEPDFIIGCHIKSLLLYT